MSSTADEASTGPSESSASPQSRRDRLSARIKHSRNSARNLQMPVSRSDSTSARVDMLLSEESSFGSPTSQEPRRVDSYDAPEDERESSFATATDESEGASVSDDGASNGNSESNIGSDSDREEDGDSIDQSAEESEDEDRTTAADRNLTKTKHASKNDAKSTCSSSAASSAPSSPTARYNRVPGGAAAKLMLMGPQKTLSEDNDDDQLETNMESQDRPPTPTPKTEEIGQILKQTKTEFSVGDRTNRRYNENEGEANPNLDAQQLNETVTNQTSEPPRFLKKTEIFHSNAAAAVAAVLTPRERPTIFNDSNSVFSAQELLSVVSSGSAIRSSDSQNAGPLSPKLSNETSGSGSSPRKQPTSGVLLSDRAKAKVESLQTHMKDPDKTLSDLLTAIAEPENEPNSLNYTVRRKNACGALHVLTTNSSNRVPLCWTMGVLPALTSVLNNDDVEGTYPDVRQREEFLAARERAISSLLNLSSPIANRIPVFHTPQLVPTLVSLVLHDAGSARKGCSAILAFMSKTVENRLLLAKVPGLFKAIVQVILPRQPRIESKPAEVAEKKTYPWSEDDDESEASVDRNHSFVTQGTSYTSYTETGSTNLPPKLASSQSAVELSGYDETADENLRQARQYLFALLSHLVKEKDNAYLLSRDSTLVTTLVRVAEHHESQSHLLALRILANLTRHRQNTKLLVFQQRTVLPSLVRGTQSENEEARQYSCWALQNLAQDKACRQELATTEHLMECLCDRARHGGVERLASISALKNLCDEPANLIPMTNTPDCIATLMHIAHAGSSGNDSMVEDTMQYRACDSLATLSHWLRKIATSGQQQQGSTPQPLIVPTLKVVTWNQWH